MIDVVGVADFIFVVAVEEEEEVEEEWWSWLWKKNKTSVKWEIATPAHILEK